MPIGSIDLSMRFDLRVPPFAETDYATQHQACLDMAQWAEDQGFDRIIVAEHHGDPAGFTSAPLTLAAAILGRTRRISVLAAAMLVPLHDPVRLAEQIATIDCLAPGRLGIVAAAGYRRAEFEMAGIDRSQRGHLVEECIDVWRRAWTGEPFEWRGRSVLVTPTPSSPDGPMVLIGGKSIPAARRAARLRCPFFPANALPELRAAYEDECKAVGYDGVVIGPGAKASPAGFMMVATDPDATWRQIGENALYDATTYASWQDDGVTSGFVVKEAGNVEKLRASGQYLVLTPEQCRDFAKEYSALLFHPLMGGISPELAWEGLRLAELEVMPKFSNT